MFRYSTHMALSLITSLLLFEYAGIDWKYNLIIIFGVLIGSILPDCDLRYAAAGGILPLWILFERHARKYHYEDAVARANKKRNGDVEKELIFYYHRTYTHNIHGIIIVTILTLVSLFLALKYTEGWIETKLIYLLIGLFLGYILHIVEDSFTRSGIKLFYPYLGRSYGLKIFRTGKTEENLIYTSSVIYFMYLMLIKGLGAA